MSTALPIPEAVVNQVAGAVAAAEADATRKQLLAGLPPILDGAEWVERVIPRPPDQLLDVCSRGDKGSVIGPAKVGKTWFNLYLAVALSVGLKFLRWQVPKPVRILFVQAEIKEYWFHWRLRKILRSLGCSLAPGYFNIFNGRGLALPELLANGTFRELAKETSAEVVFFDPLYKFTPTGREDAEDFRPVLFEFDRIAEEAHATVFYSHHCTKGFAGERNTLDRGAGSSLLARDIDFGFYLTPHARDGYVVCELPNRNAAENGAFTIRLNPDTLLFQEVSDVAAEVKTAASAKAKSVSDGRWKAHGAPASDDEVVGLVENGPMSVHEFIELLAKLGFSRDARRATKDRLQREKRVAVWRQAGFQGSYMVGLPSAAPAEPQPVPSDDPVSQAGDPALGGDDPAKLAKVAA